jgi:hypothetical protein
MIVLLGFEQIPVALPPVTVRAAQGKSHDGQMKIE